MSLGRWRSVRAWAALLVAAAAPLAAEAWRATVGPPVESGWQRLVLPADAQRVAETLWLSDADGAPLPFLRADELASGRGPVALEEVVVGRDESGRPLLEFSPVAPPAAGPPARLEVELELSGETPWIARLEVARRRADGEWIVRDGEPLWLDDLGGGRERRVASIPWDGDRFRIRVVPLEGSSLDLERFSVVSDPVVEPGRRDVAVALALTDLAPTRAERRYRLELPERDRLLAVELDLAPPLAPVGFVLRRPMEDPYVPGPLVGRGTVWNLPALESRRDRVDLLRPMVLDELELWGPPEVEVASARGVVRRESLFFPAEAGQPLYLHWGDGARRVAAGSLDALTSGAELYNRPPLALGERHPDPDARAVPRRLADRLREILVPLVALVAVVLAVAGWRLFREGEAEKAA